MTQLHELNSGNRDRVIIRTSYIGIGANVLLAVFKMVVGLISHSIAVILDSVNNFSDALSSVITILGIRLAGKKPDKAHPLGYGRVEYLSALIVSGIVLYAGLTSLTESVKKILHPELPDYSVVSLVIIAAAVVVKVLLGRYVKSVGEKVNSGSLVASGSDALSDAILSASVLACALIYKFSNVSLEAYIGVVIAVMIIKAGIEMMKDTVDDLLGRRIDEDTIRAIKQSILEIVPEAYGAYDLMLHNYGPNHLMGSVHVTVDGDMTAEEIDLMSRKISYEIYEKYGILLSGIGIYAEHTDGEAGEARQKITKIVMSHPEVLQMHGFHFDSENKDIVFDVVIDFGAKNRDEISASIRKEVRDAYPDWNIMITDDPDL